MFLSNVCAISYSIPLLKILLCTCDGLCECLDASKSVSGLAVRQDGQTELPICICLVDIDAVIGTCILAR